MSDFLTDEQMAAIEEEEKKRGGAPSSETVGPGVQKRLQETPPGFIPDDEMDRLAGSGAEDLEGQIAEALRYAGNTGLEYLGKALNTVDQYTTGPVRAAIGEQMGMPVKRGKQSALSLFFPALGAGELYPEPPSGADLAARAGMSEEDSIDLPLIANPFTRERVKTSPAELAGGAVEFVTDPATYLGLGAIDDVGRAVGRGIKSRGAGLRDFARERAVKAATGENRSAIRKLAKVSGKGSGDVERAMENLRRTGDILLEPDPNFGGKPAVRPWSSAAGIGEEAERRRKFYGGEIGKVGPVVDRLNPGAITPGMLADDVQSFAREIPRAGKGNTIRNRVQTEADLLRQYGLAEDEYGPPAPLQFKQAQDLKGQYPWEPTSPDVLISDKDASNRVHGIIGRRMDQAVEGAKAGDGLKRRRAVALDELGAELGTLKKEIGDAYKAGVPPRYRQDMHDATRAWNNIADQHGKMLDEDFAPKVSGNDLAILDSYPHSKERYGVYKGVGDASTEQAMRTLGRNIASPSTKAIGLLELFSGGTPTKAALYMAANQIALSRGNAFVARTANAIGKKIQRGGAIFNRWRPILTKAAQGGYGALVAAHHQLMNSDPSYRGLMLDDGEEP